MQKNDLRKTRSEKAVTKQFHKFLEETPMPKKPVRGKVWTNPPDGLKLSHPGDKTYHSGANDERTAILAKVRRIIKKPVHMDQDFIELEQWLLNRNERYRKNPGGL